MKSVDQLEPSEFVLPPLHQAARQRDVTKVKAFIGSGFDVNEPDLREANGDGGNTPLWYAAQGLSAGGVPVAQALIEAGADINAKGEHGMTPLHMACSWGHPDMVAFLCAQGADCDAVDDYGRTPVGLARADYEEGKATPQETQPAGFADWLAGMTAINQYFDELGL